MAAKLNRLILQLQAEKDATLPVHLPASMASATPLASANSAERSPKESSAVDNRDARAGLLRRRADD
jgi:hypothetical protein